MTTIQLDNTQEVIVTLTPKTAKGKPAKIDGIPTWTVQSGSSTVTPAADGLSAKITSQDVVDDDAAKNETEILAEADADLGSGFVPLDETLKVVVSAPAATSLGVSVGAPTDKPDAPAIAARTIAARSAAKAAKPTKKAKK